MGGPVEQRMNMVKETYFGTSPGMLIDFARAHDAADRERETKIVGLSKEIDRQGGVILKQRATLIRASEALRDAAAHMESLAQHLDSGADSNALILRAVQARAALAAIKKVTP